MKTLFLLRGVPGSGKTTLAHYLSAMLITGGKAFSADDYMKDENGEYKFDASRLQEVHHECQFQTLKAMHEGVLDIFVHNTFCEEWQLKPYFKMAELNGYRVFSLVVENRHGNPSVHNLDEETMQRFRSRMEVKI